MYGEGGYEGGGGGRSGFWLCLGGVVEVRERGGVNKVIEKVV